MDGNTVGLIVCTIACFLVGAYVKAVSKKVGDLEAGRIEDAKAISELKTEVKNFKEARENERSELNRRFDEIKGSIEKLTGMVAEVLLHRRKDDE